MTRFTPKEKELLLEVLHRELIENKCSRQSFIDYGMASKEYQHKVVTVFDKEIILVGSMIDKLENGD